MVEKTAEGMMYGVVFGMLIGNLFFDGNTSSGLVYGMALGMIFWPRLSRFFG